MFEDTIISISTPIGFGGLGIIRLSGNNSLSIAKKIFKPKKGRQVQPRRSVFGHLYNFEQKEYFEEAYLTFFPKPRTYTRENMVEISCHGSPVILEEAIRLGIKAGARPANPGEFTLRAYLSGRIDLLQAEAVNDLIRASSLRQARLSFNQVEGKLSSKMASLRAKVVHLLARIEASLEFPDEGLRASPKQTEKTLENLVFFLRQLIRSYDIGKSLVEGITLAITGRANVGKSTLFNSLLERDRAIVTPYPGTTRDYLKESIRINEAIFTLIDMAGIERSSHPAEKEGVRKGKRIAEKAEGVLLLLDSSRRESPEDFRLIEKFKTKKTLLLFNKMDLPQKMNKTKLKGKTEQIPALDISALKGTNLNKLKKMISEFFLPTQEESEDIILHLRQKLLLEDIEACLIKGQHLLKEGYPEEIYVEEIRKAVPLIGQLTGEIRSDEIIEDIFRRFCVGK
ncbi:MAG: tRNA uridine-5-carboxymethylaminomethyl(34) synthesis GTPase MnmE [Candidatus Aminicenantes bacterium]|nr:tRNA uridine-5-carboxymethylaminomethyl(34) synthesis GTPase MnmE [Candidatus Aminicenantes bacterium]